MPKAFALLTLLAAAMLLAVGCTSNPAQGNPSLPPGFADAKVPKADLNAYVYVSQGAPVSLPTKWFGDLATAKSNPSFAAVGDSVRVNSLATGLTAGDVEGVVAPGIDAIVLPKTEAPEDLNAVDAMLAAAERRAGLPPGRVKVLPIVETARGLLAA